LRLVTWNVAGRVRSLPEQAAAVAEIAADVVALQEVTVCTEPLWRAALADARLAFCETAISGLPPGKSRRRLAVLTC
jgi:exonuclease III